MESILLKTLIISHLSALIQVGLITIDMTNIGANRFRTVAVSTHCINKSLLLTFSLNIMFGSRFY